MIISTVWVINESKSGNPETNEDCCGFTDNRRVIADGATDKSGMHYEDGLTWGQILAQFIVDFCLEYDGPLTALIDNLTEDINSLYATDYPKAKEGFYRFSSTMLYAQLSKNHDKLHIIQVGDGGFRINADQTYLNSKIIDKITANTRSEYIKLTGDISGSRNVIMPLLQNQYQYQNNPDHPLWYGVINGETVPKIFIKQYEFDTSILQSLELFTDGYFDHLPDSALTASREDMYQEMNSKDPHRYMIRKGTKEADDRTVMVIKFSSDE